MIVFTVVSTNFKYSEHILGVHFCKGNLNQLSSSQQDR
uniref:Uncharacterized protein n=1 Tax=Manihot esculenta TaxID=3983 RepID=A0A2C9VJ25_MANES